MKINVNLGRSGLLMSSIAFLALACAGDVGEEPVEQIASEVVVYPPACTNTLTCKSAAVLPACASPLGCKCTNGKCLYQRKNLPTCPCIAGEVQTCPDGKYKTCVKAAYDVTQWGVCK